MKIKTVVIFVVVVIEGGTREFSVVLEMAMSGSEGVHFIESIWLNTHDLCMWVCKLYCKKICVELKKKQLLCKVVMLYFENLCFCFILYFFQIFLIHDC